MIFNNNFILASSSLSRYKILKNNNLNFSVKHPKCNENILKKKLIKKKIPIKNISLELSKFKALSVSKLNKNKLVVGADTVIDLGGVILNKAKNINDAKKKIFNISGRKHLIYSSASVFLNEKEIWSRTQKSTIKIRKLSKIEINEYILGAGKKILSSVGCYHAETTGPNIIEEITGDFFNVLGFPLFPFLKFLKKYKIRS